MTKSEKIQESYGEYWESIKVYVDENGWLDGRPHDNQLSNIYNRMFNDCDREFDSIRPKSLQGIENNNGYIKIENKEDLPKKLGEYDFVYQDRIIRMGFDPKIEDLHNCAKNYSHWKPIEKIKFPVY